MSRKQNICFFAGFGSSGKIHNYVVYYLQQLSRSADIYYLMDGTASSGQLDRIKPFVRQAWAYPHGKRDFGAWRELALKVGWDKVAGHDRLILADDSCFAPLFPFEEMFGAMSGRFDFWGATYDNLDYFSPHLQKYFMVFERKVLAGSELRNLLLKPFDDRPAFLQDREREEILTGLLADAGYLFGAYMGTDSGQKITSSSPCASLVKKRCPFLSAKHFTDWTYPHTVGAGRTGIGDIASVCNHADYPPALFAPVLFPAFFKGTFHTCLKKFHLLSVPYLLYHPNIYWINYYRIFCIWTYPFRRWLADCQRKYSPVGMPGGRTPLAKAVYTVMTGGYDELKIPLYFDPGWDYICFTDDDALLKNGHPFWKIRPVKGEKMDTVRLSRHAKIMAHKFLPQYDYSLFIDCSIDILSPRFFEKAQEFIAAGVKLAIPEHPERNCAYREAAVCELHGKSSADIMGRQMRIYAKEGFVREYGLKETNIILRRHNDPAIIRMMEEWWRWVENFSRRDQLSLMYVLWKHNYGTVPAMPGRKEPFYFHDIFFSAHKAHAKPEMSDGRHGTDSHANIPRS